MTHSRTQPGVTAGDRIGLSALGAACVLVAMLAPAKAATEPERLTSFKAVFMYNFIDYVQWPEETSADVFKVGILGKSPVEGPLREIARKRGAGSRKIQIDVFADIEQLQVCNMLFISSSFASQLEEVLDQLNEKSTLTISDTPGLANKGSAINFVLAKGKLKFEINRRRLYDAGLQVSSQLLKLAILVEDDGAKEGTVRR